MTQLLAISFLLISSHAQAPHPGTRSNDQAQFLFEEAMKAEKEGNADLAIEDYRKILKSYPLFPEKLGVYQQLMSLSMAQKKYSEVNELGKQALHLNPSKNYYSTIQLMRAEASLKMGKTSQSKVVAEEILKSKPDANAESAALLIKAEAYSQLGKHAEAFASLDAVKNNPAQADVALKIRTRSCSSKQRKPKEAVLDYFHQKNLCFKESAALSRSEPSKDAAQTWCDRFHGFEDELKKAKADSFTKERLKAEMDNTKALSSTWGCS